MATDKSEKLNVNRRESKLFNEKNFDSIINYYENFDFNNLEIRILIIGDYSMYEKFLEMYNGDGFVAYNALYQYLNAIFEEVRH